MTRLILEDVTLLRREQITAYGRFRGGATRTLVLPVSLPAPQAQRTDQAVIREIDRLLDNYTDGQIATLLNQQELRTGEGNPFHRLRVREVRLEYGLRDRFTRLRAQGMLTQEEMALGLASAPPL